MSPLHESFDAIEGPSCKSLVRFSSAHSRWSQTGNPPFQAFDFLDWADLLDWISVVHFPRTATDRYTLSNAQFTYDGTGREDLFQSRDTDINALDSFFIERWASIYLECVSQRSSIFARSRVRGIDMDFIQFEIGLFPFFDPDDQISDIVSLVERIEGSD